MVVAPVGRRAACGAGRLAAAVILLALALLAPGARAAHADKAFELVSLETTAFLRADATMAVTEVVTYDFHGGPFTVGIRSFEDDLDKIDELVVSDEEGPLVVDPPATSESGDYEWRLRRPVSDARMRFTLTYTVRGAVALGRDVADLNWRFLGTEHSGFGSVSITVVPPGVAVPATPETEDTDTSALRGFAHGPRNGRLEVAATGVTATATDVPAEQFVQLRVVMPISLFNTIGTEPLLGGILAQERQAADDEADAARQDEEHHDQAYLWTPLLSVGAFLGTALLWFAAGREPRSGAVLGDYWREPLEEPPAITITNLERGKVPVGRAFAATLVDLAQRGYVRITGERQERWGPDRTLHHYEWAGNAFGPEVTPWERTLADFVFRGQPRTDSIEVESWAKDHQAEAHRRLQSFEAAIRRDWTRRGWHRSGARLPVVLLFVLCVGCGGASYLLYRHTEQPVAWVGVGVAVAMFALGLKLLANRTPPGADAAAKAEGLRRFLRDFSRLEDAPVGHLILWERYLVFAVALGVADELVQGLHERLPALVADPQFSRWYAPPHGSHTRFDGFDVVGSTTASIVSASTPSSTGSSGGFSGGSTGGGGGGGFGAR